MSDTKIGQFQGLRRLGPSGHSRRLTRGHPSPIGHMPFDEAYSVQPLGHRRVNIAEDNDHVRHERSLA